MTAPNAAEFVLLSIGDSCGADPWSARVPLDPLFARRINSFVCVRHTESTTWPAEVAALQTLTGVFGDEVGCSAVAAVVRKLREEGGERSRGGGSRADGRSAHGFHPPGVWGRWDLVSAEPGVGGAQDQCPGADFLRESRRSRARGTVAGVA